MSINYYLLAIIPQFPGKKSIHAREPRFTVSVYDTGISPFEPDRSALQFYASMHERPVVFEAAASDAANGSGILDAIQWYADYMGMPDLELTVTEPHALQQKIQSALLTH